MSGCAAPGPRHASAGMDNGEPCAIHFSRSLKQLVDAMNRSPPAPVPQDTIALHRLLRKAEFTSAGPFSTVPAGTPSSAKRNRTVRSPEAKNFKTYFRIYYFPNNFLLQTFISVFMSSYT